MQEIFYVASEKVLRYHSLMMTDKDIAEAVRQKAIEVGSQHLLAIRWGMHYSEVNAVANGRRKPSKRVLEGLGLESFTGYRQKSSAPSPR